MVDLSTISTRSTCAMYCEGWSPRLMTRSNDHLTSSTVMALPVENLTPSRSVKRQPLPSGVRAHLVASEGATLMYSPGFMVTSES